jgi:hypothetical protein
MEKSGSAVDFAYHISESSVLIIWIKNAQILYLTRVADELSGSATSFSFVSSRDHVFETNLTRRELYPVVVIPAFFFLLLYGL